MCEKRPAGSGNRSPYLDESVVGKLAKISGELEDAFERGDVAYCNLVNRYRPDGLRLFDIVNANYQLYVLIGKFALGGLDLQAFLLSGELRLRVEWQIEQRAKNGYCAPGEWEMYG